ncbi:MAG: hypothetical protein GXO93_08725 [FCB group bacterium]|nr:hypothetical protein [FCB group bacterium]
MKREIPVAITFIVGTAYLIAYFIPHEPFNYFENWFNDWFAVIAAFAIWLGVLNLIKISTIKIVRKSPDWPYSVLIIVSFIIIVFFGFYEGYRGLYANPHYSFRDPGTSFDWLYVNVYTPLSATMFALLAFFVASASYRAFRARNFEATLLLLAAFLVMLGRVPVGDILTSWLPHQYQLSQWANWIMHVPNTAGQRAIMIGIALGLVSTSLRIILGLERSYLGND